MVTDNKTQLQPPEQSQELKDLLEVGAHITHKKSKTHPKMKQFIIGRKNEIQFIDVEKILESLNKVLEFIKNTLSNNKEAIILFVATQPQFRLMIQEMAKKLNTPYVINRWLGGTLTNFKTILKRLNYYKDLEQKKESGELKNYTKREQLLFEKELKNFEEKMGGIKNLTKLPDIIFIIDINKHKTALREAMKTRIPVVGIVDVDADFTKINYPVIANDHSIKSVKYILNKIEQVISEIKNKKAE